MQKLMEMLRGIRAEYGRITFPDKEEIKNGTGVIITWSLALGTAIFAMDTCFRAIAGMVFK